MNSISANLNIMIKASEKASKILIRDFGEIEKLQVSKKGPADFVTNSDLNESYNQVRKELNKYNPKLSKKKEIIVFNKIDLIEDKVLEEKLLNFSKKNRKNFNLISILKKNGLKKIKQMIIENVHT